MTVSILADFAKAIDGSIATGEYASAEDALADALGAWTRRHEEAAEDLARLKASLTASMNDPRPSLPMDEVRAHVKALATNAKTRANEAA